MLAVCGVIVAGLLTASPVLVVAALLALLGCAAILSSPYMGIIVFLGLMYLRPELFAPRVADMRLPLILSCLTLVAWLLHVLLKRETFHWTPQIGWIAAFGGAMILSSFQVHSTKAIVLCVLDAVRISFLVLLLSQLLNTEKRAHQVMQWFLAFNVIIALYAIYGWFTKTSVLNENGVYRAIVLVGDFDDPNDLSAALVIAVPIALLLALKSRHVLARMWGVVAAGILTLAIYLCDSRGGILALGMALAVFLIYHLGWKKGILLGLIVVGVVFACGPQRFNEQSLEGDDSSMGRIEAWRAGLQMFQSAPLTGIGYTEFVENHPIPAHDSFIHGLAEGGLPTALCWVGMNYWAVLTLVRVRRQKHEDGVDTVWKGYGAAVQAGLLASLTAGFFLSHTYRPIPLIPVGFAAALGILGGIKSSRRDWVHLAAIPVLTAALIGIFHLLVRINL